MQTKVFATTALLALVAGTEAARQKPYMVARAPESALNGLMRRSYDGYTPETELCGDGKTCSEACGAGYEQCASNDSNNHCFNPTVGDTCCGVNSGDSCETGFYCAHDSNSNTICCPENLDLKDCAAALSPDDSLTSDFPAAPTAAPTTTVVEEPKPTDPVVEAPKPTDPVVEAPKPTDPVVVSSSTYLVIQTSSSLGAAPTDSPHDPVQSSSGTPPGPTGLPEGAASGIQATLGLAAAALFVALF